MSNVKRQEKRSPLKEKPLRNPGESVQEEIQGLLDDRLMPPFLTAVLAVAFAGFEWWHSLTSAPPQPWPVTIVACVAVGYVAYRYVSLRKRVRSLWLGLDGEKAVGQYLEAHRDPSWRVFHDIPGTGFNVDHVIIAPQGVFAVETKTFSKPAKGDAKVTYDGERILVNGRQPDRDPVAQARAIRDWLEDLLFDTTGRRYPVRGVVVFPEWWIEPPADNKRTDIWVLNPKALPAFIEHEPIMLKEEDIALASSRLVNYVTHL